MLDKAIKVENTWETQSFSPGGGVVKQTHYQFRCSGMGPFFISLGAGENTDEKAHDKMNEKCRSLRETGIIPTPQG